MINKYGARAVDELGRICLPIDIRSRLGINVGDKVSISCDSNKIYMTKATAQCTLCKSDKELIEYKDIHICRDCCESIKNII